MSAVASTLGGIAKGIGSTVGSIFGGGGGNINIPAPPTSARLPTGQLRERGRRAAGASKEGLEATILAGRSQNLGSAGSTGVDKGVPKPSTSLLGG